MRLGHSTDDPFTSVDQHIRKCSSIGDGLFRVSVTKRPCSASATESAGSRNG